MINWEELGKTLVSSLFAAALTFFFVVLPCYMVVYLCQQELDQQDAKQLEHESSGLWVEVAPYNYLTIPEEGL